MDNREEGEISGDESAYAEIRRGINQEPPSSTSGVFKFMETIMAAQNHSFQKAMRDFARRQPDQQKTTILPEFNPDLLVDARAWLSTADLCLQDESKEGGTDMILTLSRAMKGRAAQWFAQVTYPLIIRVP
uniref:Uncharacterized protein n=1 Tax=Cacopsylla melanoneura TaxID=428564 RepID=A0A8D8WCZ4_9HEMI